MITKKIFRSKKKSQLKWQVSEVDPFDNLLKMLRPTQRHVAERLSQFPTLSLTGEIHTIL